MKNRYDVAERAWKLAKDRRDEARETVVCWAHILMDDINKHGGLDWRSADVVKQLRKNLERERELKAAAAAALQEWNKAAEEEGRV